MSSSKRTHYQPTPHNFSDKLDPKISLFGDKWLVHIEHHSSTCKEVCTQEHQHVAHCKQVCRLPVLKNIDIRGYFLTTGDAITKLEQLERDAYTLAGQARVLINLAKKIRGKDKWLETSLENCQKVLDGGIWCRPISPKIKTNTLVEEEIPIDASGKKRSRKPNKA